MYILIPINLVTLNKGFFPFICVLELIEHLIDSDRINLYISSIFYHFYTIFLRSSSDFLRRSTLSFLDDKKLILIREDFSPNPFRFILQSSLFIGQRPESLKEYPSPRPGYLCELVIFKKSRL